MTYRVTILPRAELDARQIFEWIAERSREGAVRWRAALKAAAAKLSENPLGYELAPESELTGFELRQFLFKTRRGKVYRGVFVILENEIRVLRIRGPGQPWLELDEIE